MGTASVINGIVVYILITLCKYIFVKDNSRGFRRVLNAIQITLRKRDLSSLVSAVQLYGLCWLLIGIIENILGDSLKNIPEIILFAGEDFIPTILLIVALKIINS